jgi:hypothetical protein
MRSRDREQASLASVLVHHRRDSDVTRSHTAASSIGGHDGHRRHSGRRTQPKGGAEATKRVVSESKCSNSSADSSACVTKTSHAVSRERIRGQLSCRHKGGGAPKPM